MKPPLPKKVLNHRTGGEHRRQPILRILSHASMALYLSIRLRVYGIGGIPVAQPKIKLV